MLDTVDVHEADFTDHSEIIEEQVRIGDIQTGDQDLADIAARVDRAQVTGDHGLDRRRCAVAVVELTGKVDAADHRRECQRGQVDAAEVLDDVGDRYTQLGSASCRARVGQYV